MKARKKPVEIEYYPCEHKYLDDIMKWSTKERPIEYGVFDILNSDEKEIKLVIRTLEGNHEATKLDMIIKGVNGEVYPCKKDIFEKTYDIISGE